MTMMSVLTLFDKGKHSDKDFYLFIFMKHYRENNGDILKTCQEVIDFSKKTEQKPVLEQEPVCGPPEPEPEPEPVCGPVEPETYSQKVKHKPEPSNGPVIQDEDEEVESPEEEISIQGGITIKKISKGINVVAYWNKSLVPDHGFFFNFMSIENSEEVYHIKYNQVPWDVVSDLSCSTVMTITGAFRLFEKTGHWQILDGEDFDLKFLEVTGKQKNKMSANGKKSTVVVSDQGTEYFLSNKEKMESNGKCKFNVYKLREMDSLAACNLESL